MLIKIQMSTLPSCVTGSRLSESLDRANVKVPPALPAGAAVACSALPGVGVSFWLTVTGPLLAAEVAGPATGAPVPQAASSGPAAPTPASSRRKLLLLCPRGMAAESGNLYATASTTSWASVDGTTHLPSCITTP